MDSAAATQTMEALAAPKATVEMHPAAAINAASLGENNHDVLEDVNVRKISLTTCSTSHSFIFFLYWPYSP